MENKTNNYYFDGNVLEFILLRLAMIFLSAITLGIATPWCIVEYLKWQYSHTVLNGKRLKFKGTGFDLFLKAILWIFLLIITFGLYIFFITVSYKKWEIENLEFID